MSLTPFLNTLASGANGTSITETFDVDMHGRRGLILFRYVSAIGNGHSFAQGAAVTAPKTITLNTNDQFSFNSNVYTIAPGTYATLALLATAIGAATKSGGALFSAVVTTAVSGTGFLFTNVASGVHAEAFAVGTHDALVSVLGITNGWTIAQTSPAGADGAYSATVTIQGKDEASGNFYDILSSAALTTAATAVLQVSPTLVAVANLVANALLPSNVRVKITHTTNNVITHTLAVQLLS